MTVRRSLWLVALVLASGVAASGCEEELQQALGIDQPAALGESELPNCSRVVNCCSRLGQEPYASLIPSAVSSTCDDTLGVAAGTVIDQYQSQRSGIQAQSGITDETRNSLLTDLRGEYQNRVEPGCRCFLEETVGTVPDLATPGDCESFTTTGALQGATCDDGIGAVIDAATNGI